MKSLKFAALTCLTALFFISDTRAGENPKTVNEVLRDKIVEFIDHPDMSKLDGRKFTAEVEFIVTRQNRLVVLAVYTDNQFFDEYIKDRLNYKKLSVKGIKRLTPYRLNVNFILP